MTARRVRHANQPELVAAVPVARWAASGDAGQRVLSRKDPRVSALVATGTGAARTEYGADQHRRMHVSRTEAARSTLQSTPGRCSASITCAAPRRAVRPSPGDRQRRGGVVRCHVEREHRISPAGCLRVGVVAVSVRGLWSLGDG